MKDITKLIVRAERNRKEVEKYKKLDKQELINKPSGGGWTILEVIEHLNLTYELYLPNIKNALNSCPERSKPQDKYARTLAGILMTKGVKPKNGKRKLKMKTFGSLTPSEALELESVFERYFRNQQLFSNYLKEAPMKDHRKAKVISAVGPVIKFKLGESFEFLLTHEERHLLQANEIHENIKNSD